MTELTEIFVTLRLLRNIIQGRRKKPNREKITIVMSSLKIRPKGERISINL